MSKNADYLLTPVACHKKKMKKRGTRFAFALAAILFINTKPGVRKNPPKPPTTPWRPPRGAFATFSGTMDGENY